MRWNATLGALGALACAETWEDMEVAQVCDDVGFSIAARTMECTGDPDLATAREASFDRRYRCEVSSLEEPIERYYACPVQAYALSCPEVESAGDDLALWLEASWVCDVILTDKEGG